MNYWVVVGICRIEVAIIDSRSLKDKRQVTRSLTEQIKGNFNVSIAQVDRNDSWQHAIFGLACINTDKRHANKIIDKIVQFVRSHPKVALIDYEVEIL